MKNDNANILIMDDEVLVLEMVKTMLEFSSHNVLTENINQEKLKIYRQSLKKNTPH
jgi:CheY-like chemotaxis protein